MCLRLFKHGQRTCPHLTRTPASYMQEPSKLTTELCLSALSPFTLEPISPLTPSASSIPSATGMLCHGQLLSLLFPTPHLPSTILFPCSGSPPSQTAVLFLLCSVLALHFPPYPLPSNSIPLPLSSPVIPTPLRLRLWFPSTGKAGFLTGRVRCLTGCVRGTQFVMLRLLMGWHRIESLFRLCVILGR